MWLYQGFDSIIYGLVKAISLLDVLSKILNVDHFNRYILTTLLPWTYKPMPKVIDFVANNFEGFPNSSLQSPRSTMQILKPSCRQKIIIRKYYIAHTTFQYFINSQTTLLIGRSVSKLA